LGSDAKDHGSPMLFLGWSNKKSDCFSSTMKEQYEE
jgi:hypothetical protein